MAVHGFTLHKMLPALVMLTSTVALVNSAAVTTPAAELSSPEPTILTKTVHLLGNHTTYTTSSGETTLVLVNVPPETKAQTSASRSAAGGVSMPAQSMASNLPSVTTTRTTTVFDPEYTQATTITVIADDTELVMVGEYTSAAQAPARGSPVEPSSTAPSMRTTTITLPLSATPGPSQIDSTSTSSVPASSTSSTASSSGSSDSTAVTSPPISTSQPSESEIETSHSSIILTPPFPPPPDTTDLPPFPPPDATDPPSSTKKTKFPFDSTFTPPSLGGTATNVKTITVVSTSTIVELSPSVSTPSATTSQSDQSGSPPKDVSGSEPTEGAEPADKPECGSEFHYSFTNIEMIIGQIASLFSGPKLQPLPNLAPIAGQKCMAQGGDIRCCHFQPEALASDLYYRVVCLNTPPTFCPVEMMYCCNDVEEIDGQSSHAASPSCVPIEVPEVNPPGFPPVSPPAETGLPPDSTGSPPDSTGSHSDSTGYPSDSTGSPSTTTSFPAFSSGNGEPPAETTDPPITTPASSHPTSTSGYGSITSFPATPPSSGNGGSGSSESADSLDTEALSDLLDKIGIISECIESAWEDDDDPSETGSSPSGGASMTTTKVTTSGAPSEVNLPVNTAPGSPPSPQPTNGSIPAYGGLHCCRTRFEDQFWRWTIDPTKWCQEGKEAIRNCPLGHVYDCGIAICVRVEGAGVPASTSVISSARVGSPSVSAPGPADDESSPQSPGGLGKLSIKRECCKDYTAPFIIKIPIIDHCEDDAENVRECPEKHLDYCNGRKCAKDEHDPRIRTVVEPAPTAAILRDVSPASDNIQPRGEFGILSIKLECCIGMTAPEFRKSGNNHCEDDSPVVKACDPQYLYHCHDKHCAKDYRILRHPVSIRDVSPASDNIATAPNAGTTFAVTVIKTSTNTRQLARPTTNIPPPHDFFMQTQRECIETGGTVECCPSRKEDHFFKTGSDNCSVEEEDLEACLNEHLYCCKPYRPGVAPQYRTMCNRFQYLDPINDPIYLD